MRNPKSVQIVIDDDPAPGGSATAGREGDTGLELGRVLQVDTAAELLGNTGDNKLVLLKVYKCSGF